MPQLNDCTRDDTESPGGDSVRTWAAGVLSTLLPARALLTTMRRPIQASALGPAPPAVLLYAGPGPLCACFLLAEMDETVAALSGLLAGPNTVVPGLHRGGYQAGSCLPAVLDSW